MMRGRVRNRVHVGTWLWQQHSQEMNSVMARHDSLLTSAVEANGGTVVRPREKETASSPFSSAPQMPWLPPAPRNRFSCGRGGRRALP